MVRMNLKPGKNELSAVQGVPLSTMQDYNSTTPPLIVLLHSQLHTVLESSLLKFYSRMAFLIFPSLCVLLISI